MRKPQLIEIARLARQGQLILPKEARSLLADLAEIESHLPSVTTQLTSLTALLYRENTQLFSPEKSLKFLDTLADIVELLDRLIAIARNHPDPPEPGVQEGFAPCYVETIKQVNDLRYNLAYIREHLRPQNLAQECDQSLFLDLQLTAMLNVINDLDYTAMALVPRLRENITRKVPQMFGSVP